MSKGRQALWAQFTGFLRTPQLWSKNGIFEYDLFELPEAIPEEIASEELLQPETGVLGKRMEHFFMFFIENYSEENVLAHNEQIFEEKQTIGELDFLLKHSKTGKITHVELVYKFYLYDPEIPSGRDRWIGPNRKDSLPKKLKRLSQRQFPLLHHPAAKDLLERLQVSPAEISQKVCFKACLFVPLEMEQQNFRNINPDAIAGFWIRSKEFTETRYGDALFHSPKKPDWPVLPGNKTSWKEFEDIKEEVDKMLQQGRSPLVWMKTPKGLFQRFFVVWW